MVGWMALAEVGVRTMPLPRLAELFGLPLQTSEAVHPSGGAPLALTGATRRRLRAVEVVGAHWPFCAGPCLRQALVAGRVLRRLEPRLVVGADLVGDHVVGHAWIELRGATVGHSLRFGALSDGRVP